MYSTVSPVWKPVDWLKLIVSLAGLMQFVAVEAHREVHLDAGGVGARAPGAAKPPGAPRWAVRVGGGLRGVEREDLDVRRTVGDGAGPEVGGHRRLRRRRQHRRGGAVAVPAV